MWASPTDPTFFSDNHSIKCQPVQVDQRRTHPEYFTNNSQRRVSSFAHGKVSAGLSLTDDIVPTTNGLYVPGYSPEHACRAHSTNYKCFSTNYQRASAQISCASTHDQPPCLGTNPVCLATPPAVHHTRVPSPLQWTSNSAAGPVRGSARPMFSRGWVAYHCKALHSRQATPDGADRPQDSTVN